MEKSKFATLILSFVPGVGHLYLGLMTRGLQFMLLFFGSAFVIHFIRIDALMVMLPVIWFYSFFDALQARQRVNEGVIEDEPLQMLRFERLNHRWVAYALIVLGVFIMFEKFLVPMTRDIMRIAFDYRLPYYQLRDAFIAAIFIFIGTRLLKSRKSSTEQGESQAMKEGKDHE
ncbi:hypothetical protein [Caldalkalibacillus salinus]|uniref:hypothetical protein n=1 Tax=Caldalkalibacillus salinus TaxID=2803787 RepID=UPI001920EF0C|nr:hypothetical protein [Caldalkalibacillus salinus]